MGEAKTDQIPHNPAGYADGHRRREGAKQSQREVRPARGTGFPEAVRAGAHELSVQREAA